MKAIKTVRLVSPSQMYAAKPWPERRAIVERAQKELGVAIDCGFLSGEERAPTWIADGGEAASPEERLQELKDAFNDPCVDALWVTRGGTPQMEIVRLLQGYKPRHKKLIFGMSDNTLILAWAYQRGLPAFYAPVFNDLSRDPGSVTLESIKKVFSGQASWSLASSAEYKDWIGGQRDWQKNNGAWILQEGRAEGQTLVGNLTRLIQAGTVGMLPSLKKKILFIECLKAEPSIFSQELETLLSTRGAESIAGLCIGRLAISPKITFDTLKAIIATKEELHGKPVVANLDFGHTYPIMTLPFVGRAKLVAASGGFSLTGGVL